MSKREDLLVAAEWYSLPEADYDAMVEFHRTHDVNIHRGIDLIDAAIVRASKEMRRERRREEFLEMVRRAGPLPTSALASGESPRMHYRVGYASFVEHELLSVLKEQPSRARFCAAVANAARIFGEATTRDNA